MQENVDADAANHQLHTSPARASRFHSGRLWRRVGELRRSAITFAQLRHLLPPILYRHADASGLRRLTS